MSNWIEEEEADFQKKQDHQQRVSNTIAYSDYWAALRRQIEHDVEIIKQRPSWASMVEKDNLTVRDSYVGGFEIAKITFPAIYTHVQHGDDGVTIKVKTAIKKSMDASESTRSETLKITSDGEHVYFSSSNETYLVPEQASRHILSNLMQALKGEWK